MLPEPNEKIDGLLKRYVEQRKAESRADFELHPTTRNLLQGEVSRTFAKSEGAQKKPLLILWPRLAIAGGFTALLVVTLMVLNSPEQRQVELAQSSSTASSPAPGRIPEQPKPLLDAPDRSALAKQELSSAIPATQPKRPTGKLEIAGRSGGAAIETRSAGKASEPNDQLASAKRKIESFSAETASAKNVATDTFAKSGKEYGVAKTGITSSITPVAPAASAPTPFYTAVESQNHWRFVQQDLRAQYRQNILSPVQPKLLQSFELIRNGNRIRLLDSDGSIYEGEILADARYAFGEKDGSDKIKETSAFAFRVAGTNQQLNRIVKVTGEFSAENAGREEKTLAGKSDAIQLGEFKKQSSGGVIQGKISIGGTNEFRIRATTELQK